MASASGGAVESITLQGTITEEDLQTALQLHGRMNWGLTAGPALLLVLFITAALDSFLLAALIAASAVIVYACIQRWSPSEVAGQEVHRLVNADGVKLITSHGSRLLDWEAVFRSRRGESMVILYARAQPSAYIFPERLFATDQNWRAFCDLVEQRTL